MEKRRKENEIFISFSFITDDNSNFKNHRAEVLLLYSTHKAYQSSTLTENLSIATELFALSLQA